MIARLPDDEGSPLFAVLLAGGRGTRFWPASRASRPKQFLRLFDERSLLRLTYDRFARILPVERILVVTNPAYAERTALELPDLRSENLILEPSGRDTAPAAALSARVVRERERDAVMVVAPTDHFILDETAFAAALSTGTEAAAAGALVTFGVVPDHPATTYGYIEVEDRPSTGQAVRVLRFREKPGPAEAAAFLASGRFFWNAGIFVWRAEVFERELAGAHPLLASAVSGLPRVADPGAPDEDAFREAWERIPAISIDYALMEKAPNVKVVPLAAGWSDVGGWDAVRSLLPGDESGNRPSPDVLYIHARDCSVHREESGAHTGIDGEGARKGGLEAGRERRRLYALVGTDDLIVVETRDAVLICRRGAGEALREVVKKLAEAGREDLT